MKNSDLPLIVRRCREAQHTDEVLLMRLLKSNCKVYRKMKRGFETLKGLCVVMKSGASHIPMLSHCLLLSKSTEASFSSRGHFPLSCSGNSAALPGSLFTGPLCSTWSRTLHLNHGLYWIKEHIDYCGPCKFTIFFFFFAVGFLSSAPTLPSPVAQTTKAKQSISKPTKVR